MRSFFIFQRGNYMGILGRNIKQGEMSILYRDIGRIYKPPSIVRDAIKPSKVPVCNRYWPVPNRLLTEKYPQHTPVSRQLFVILLHTISICYKIVVHGNFLVYLYGYHAINTENIIMGELGNSDCRVPGRYLSWHLEVV